jgi:RHS repeat-associated protein
MHQYINHSCFTPVNPNFSSFIAPIAICNGNILTLNSKDASGNMIDQMAYNYQTGTNKLTHIGDFVADNAFTYDTDNQSANNYAYDAIGNLTQDVKGGLSSIAWNPYGKITQISKGTNGNLYYDYDAMGNRIKKNFTQSNDNADNTWYVRDASGNIMAIYSRKNYGTNQQVLLENYELYGSSRLGSLNLGIPVEGDYNLTPTTNYTRLLGLKQYEISNHLGNVLTTFSDQRVFVANMSTTNPTALTPKLISAQDYYPFGMLMAGRSWNTDKVKFGFNDKEKDNDIYGNDNAYDFGARIYNPRIGRWLSLDPLQAKYPSISPYCFVNNMPIIAVDPNGKEIVIKYKVGEDDWGNPVYKDYTYGSKMKVPNNNYVRQTILALDKLKSSNTLKEELTKLQNDKNIKVNIAETHAFNGDCFSGVNPRSEKPANNRDIMFNPYSGLFDYSTGENFAPFIALGHEIGHALSYYYDYPNFINRYITKDKDWGTLEDKYNISKYEYPLIEEFKSKGSNNLIRTSYNNPNYDPYLTSGTLRTDYVGIGKLTPKTVSEIKSDRQVSTLEKRKTTQQP